VVILNADIKKPFGTGIETEEGEAPVGALLPAFRHSDHLTPSFPTVGDLDRGGLTLEVAVQLGK